MNTNNGFKRTLALFLAVFLLMPGALAEEAIPENPAAASAEQAQPAAPKAAAAPLVAPNEDWALLLVNPTHPLAEDYAVELVALQNGMEVDKRIYDDLNAMLIACWAAGLEPKVCSAYRTAQTQTRLYNNKVARLRAQGYGRASAKKEAAQWVALPDTSEHQTGMALDLVSRKYPNLTHKQADTPEQKWLLEHSWEYGFILRYPAEKTQETGIGYEPWHYRYVGRQAATAIHESGACLEEYLLVPSPEANEIKTGPVRP